MYCIYESVPSLSEVLAAAKAGRVNITRSNGYIVAKYADTCSFSKDWDYVTMGCRGTIFDETTGELIVLPFRKFFNKNETGDSMSALPSSGITNAEVLEKLDGSCAILFLNRNGDLQVSTPGSLESEQAIWATEWLRSHESYEIVRSLFVNKTVKCLIGEIIFPGSQVVVKYDYSKDSGIHLTAAQLFRNGGEIRYATYSELCNLSEQIGLSHCRIFSFDDFHALSDYLKEADNFEGFVLHWPDSGFRIKLKADEYVRLHRIISRIHPNRIDEAILSNEAKKSTSFSRVLEIVEEVISQFPEEHREIYETAFDELFTAAQNADTRIASVVSELRALHGGFVGPAFKKACAIDLKNNTFDIHPDLHGCVFAILDGSPPPAASTLMRMWKRIREKTNWKEVPCNEE